MSNDSKDSGSPSSTQFLAYLKVLRANRWWKNVLIVMGFVLAILHFRLEPSLSLLQSLFIGLLASCLLASSNYVLNEILDREADSQHPVKRNRGNPTNKIHQRTCYLIWIVLGTFGLYVSILLNESFFWLSVCFVLAALMYNVPPIRFKDLPILDVVCEGVNSPLRIALGWSIVCPGKTASPFLLMAFWSFGISAMTLKRRWELPVFESSQQAALYRKSFASYTQKRLQIAQWVFIVIGVGCAILYVLFSFQRTQFRP